MITLLFMLAKCFIIAIEKILSCCVFLESMWVFKGLIHSWTSRGNERQNLLITQRVLWCTFESHFSYFFVTEGGVITKLISSKFIFSIQKLCTFFFYTLRFIYVLLYILLDLFWIVQSKRHRLIDNCDQCFLSAGTT